jgi:glycosyltransferase involved in cell wall biosynthesis
MPYRPDDRSVRRPPMDDPGATPKGCLAGVSIVYLNTFPGSHYGGGEVHLCHLVTGALAAEMTVTVVAAPHSAVASSMRAIRASVIEADLSSHRLLAPLYLRRLLRGPSPAIVQGTSEYTNVLARLVGPCVGAHVVDTVHTEPGSTLSFDTSTKARLVQEVRSTAERVTRRRSDVTLTVCRALRAAYVGRGADPRKVVTVHNGIDAEGLRQRAATDSPSLGLPGSHDLLVGTVGRVEAVKGHSVLLDAVPMIVSRRPGTGFVIAGDGSRLKPLRRRVASDQLLSQHVSMVGHLDDAPAVLRDLDVYCLPSLSEGFNTTVLEAMALGIPVVATNVGGTSEAVNDGVTGTLVPAGRPDLLAAGLLDMLGSPDVRREMGAAGRRAVDEHFTVDRMVQETLGVYERLLKTRGLSGCASQ